MTTIDIYDIWQKLMSTVNVQQGGQIRPQVDFQNWFNAINMEIFHEKSAKFQLGQQINDELLLPFLKSVNVIVTPQPGKPYDIITYPSDYEYFSDCRILRQKEGDTCCAREGLAFIDGDGKYTNYTDPDYAALAQRYAGNNLIENLVYLVDNQRWESALGHPRKGPSYASPKITQFSGGFKIAPKGIAVVALDYLRTPRSAVFSYTIGTGDIVVYDSSGSVQLEWSSVLQNEFLTRLVKKYGIYIQDSLIYQAGESDKKNLV